MKNAYISDTAHASYVSSVSAGALIIEGGINIKDATGSSSTGGALYAAGGIRMKNAYIDDDTSSGAGNPTGSGAGALIVKGGIFMKDAYSMGNMTAAAFYASSDYRIKTDVVALADTDVSVDDLRPIQYINTLTGCKDMGLLAHELQSVYPWLVVGEKDGPDMQHVNYMGLIGLLIHEVQGLKRKIASMV